MLGSKVHLFKQHLPSCLLTLIRRSHIIGNFQMTAGTIERRNHRRIPVQIPVILRGQDSAGRVFFDRAQIVSIDDTRMSIVLPSRSIAATPMTPRQCCEASMMLSVAF